MAEKGGVRDKGSRWSRDMVMKLASGRQPLAFWGLSSSSLNSATSTQRYVWSHASVKIQVGHVLTLTYKKSDWTTRLQTGHCFVSSTYKLKYRSLKQVQLQTSSGRGRGREGVGGEVKGWRGEVRVDDGYRSEKFTATEHLLKIIKGSASSTQSTVPATHSKHCICFRWQHASTHSLVQTKQLSGWDEKTCPDRPTFPNAQ